MQGNCDFAVIYNIDGIWYLENHVSVQWSEEMHDAWKRTQRVKVMQESLQCTAGMILGENTFWMTN